MSVFEWILLAPVAFIGWKAQLTCSRRSIGTCLGFMVPVCNHVLLPRNKAATVNDSIIGERAYAQSVPLFNRICSLTFFRYDKTCQLFSSSITNHSEFMRRCDEDSFVVVLQGRGSIRWRLCVPCRTAVHRSLRFCPSCTWPCCLAFQRDLRKHVLLSFVTERGLHVRRRILCVTPCFRIHPRMPIYGFRFFAPLDGSKHLRLLHGRTGDCVVD